MSAGLSAAFLVNFMFWTGLAAGATAFAALLDLTGAEWAAALRSDARRFRYFLPVAVPLYLLMLLGARRLYPWISQPIGSSWLSGRGAPTSCCRCSRSRRSASR